MVWHELEVDGMEVGVAVVPFDLVELLMLLSARPGEIWYRRPDESLDTAEVRNPNARNPFA